MTDIDTSDDWETIAWADQTAPETERERAKAEHRESGVEIFVKEYPGGVQLRLQIPADKPGGFEIVHREEYEFEDDQTDNFARAVSEGERYAAMYDYEGTWLVNGAPVLH